MSRSLLQTLEGEEYDTAFFLTYTLNLRFFEGLVLPRLLRMGVRYVGILVDHTGYAETLRDGHWLEQSECGRAYIVAPVRLPGGGIQHAKAVWLSGRHHRVLVGSHNLTMSGFNDQIELTTELRSTVPAHMRALHDLGAAISRVTPPVLQSTWTRIRELLPDVAASDPERHERHEKHEIQVLTSMHEPLEDQLVREVGPVERLRVVTPFLDKDQLRRLVERTGAREVVLDVPCEGLDIPLASAVDHVPALTARSVHDKMRRRLHAKGYEFRGRDGTWTAIGSANCTHAALAHSVAQGGNLEFLVLTRGVELPTDPEFEFEPVGEPATFPSTGRTWNEGRMSSALVVTRAEYKNHELHVAWETAGHQEIALAELRLGDHAAYPLDASPAVLQLEEPPPNYVALRSIIGEDVVEARAWVTHHDALAQAAQRAQVQRWAEQIGSRDPLQLASSIDSWLTLFLLRELRRDHAVEAATEAATMEGTGAHQTVVHGQRMRDFHEVFTYSTDETRVRSAAETMLAGPKGTDPLALFRALLARLSNTTADDESSSLAAANADDPVVQRQYGAATRERELGHRRVVDALMRHLKTLTRDSTIWATAHASDVMEVIRLSASLITLIGYEVVRPSKEPGKRTQFVEAGLQWIQAIRRHPDVLPGLAVRGPLALSLAVLGDIALFEGQQQEHDRAATIAWSILGADPRAVLESWRIQCPGQADTLLTASTGRDLYEPLTLLVEKLLGMPHPALRAQLHEKWGLLIALQDADMRGLPNANALYTRAADEYSSSDVWHRYQAGRVRRQFPIIVQARNGRCPRCGLQLSLADRRKLNRGEPILNACQHVLLLGL